MTDGLSLPHLQKLLSRSNRLNVTGTDFYSTLLALFGLPTDGQPIGALCRLGDGGSADNECWLRADPVYFRPDRDRLLLFEGRFLEITQQEADAYAALFNEHFAEDGWRLEALKSDRWYLRAPEMPEVELPPLSSVSGRSVDPFLSHGAEGGPFFQLLNEIQMLFYHANPTQQRASNGTAAVNGLWLWGGGQLSEIPDTRFQRFISEEPLSKGLAKLASVPTGDKAALSGKNGATLWVDESLHQALLTDDGTIWHQAISELDHQLGQLLALLQEKRIGSLMVYPCDGHCYRIDRGALRRFWRRNRPFSDWMVE